MRQRHCLSVGKRRGERWCQTFQVTSDSAIIKLNTVCVCMDRASERQCGAHERIADRHDVRPPEGSDGRKAVTF